MRDTIEIVAATLEYVAGSVGDQEDTKWLHEVATRVATERPEDWDCCPVCEEVVCDKGCPLYNVRRAMSPVKFP